MRKDRRCRYSSENLRSAADLFEQGYGYAATATALALPASAVEKWFCKYSAVGKEGLLSMEGKNRKYSFELRLATVRAIMDDGLTIAAAMAAHGVTTRSSVQKWCKAYREGGADALRPKPKGRPKGSKAEPKNLTREQELEIRIRKLEAENAYLKKLEALRVEEELRTGSRPKW